MFFFNFQFLNVPMFRNVTLKCLTEIGRFATLIYSLFPVLYHYVIKTGEAAKRSWFPMGLFVSLVQIQLMNNTDL